MKLLLVTAAPVLAAVALATGDTPVREGEEKSATVVPSQPGVVHTGKTLGPLSPDEVNYAPVTVPEPVWASVLAACAVIVLRRGRQ
jgi:hypothetical protein